MSKELKKSHSSRWVRGAEMQNGWSYTLVWWIKIGRDPSLTPDHPAQGFSARKVGPHNFWL